MTGALVMYSTWHAPSFSLERKNWPTATLGASGEADPSERTTDAPRRTAASGPAPTHWSASGGLLERCVYHHVDGGADGFRLGR